MSVKAQPGRYGTSTELEAVCPEGFTLLVYNSHRVSNLVLCRVAQGEREIPIEKTFHCWKRSSPHLLYKLIFLFCFRGKLG